MTDARTHNDANCPSCNAAIARRYCQLCGEKKLTSQDFAVSRIFGDALSAITNLDSKFWLSWRTLLFKPGTLTTEHIAGRRNPYLGPFQLFLIASILFYIVIGDFDVFMVPSQWFFGGQNSPPFMDIPSLVAEKAASMGLSKTEIALIYDSKISGISKLYLIFAIPLLAVTTFCLRWRKAPELGKHFILATHNFTFVLFWLLVYVGINMRIPEYLPKLLMLSIAALVVYVYITLAVRKVWEDPVWKAAFIALALLLVLVLFMISYRTGISYLTLRFL